ncbi:hypothetical protein BDN67DRAFT_984357 [Paxillus ammoniavirescens]|nr:hypothetical protein BDN67DRAFT_984357 [Paxillus ammoniavirescens]
MSDTTIPPTTLQRRERPGPALGTEHAQTGVEERVLKCARISATPPPQGDGPHLRVLIKRVQKVLPCSYLLLKQVGTYWHGRSSLKDRVMRQEPTTSGEQEADEDCEFDPSSFTWVDFLASSISTPAVNVINFAVPGATVENDLEDQLAQFFDRFPKKAKDLKHREVFFLGVINNDCDGNSAQDLDSAVEAFFDVVHRLYINAMARNFILVGVPPIDRSPVALASKSGTELKDRIETWNDLLLTHASAFVSGSKQASLLLFSSDKVLTEVLDEPRVYYFDRDDVDLEDGDIWQDTLHITSAVHKIIAARMTNALGL